MKTPDRSCDGCTKCCDGWLIGEAHGKPFFPGRPCHFVGKNGCTIYKSRPDNPCKSFKCEWLVNADMPEWLKPDRANIIVVDREKNGIKYWKVQEAGSKITVEAASWLIVHCLSNSINLFYSIGGGGYRFGTPEFLKLEL